MKPGDLVTVRIVDIERPYESVRPKIAILVEKTVKPPWHHWRVLMEGKSCLLPVCFLEMINESR
tara:strand:- start:34 stop:225 length:192 start_codon:yes stop_codon:yes gene_type:complete